MAQWLMNLCNNQITYRVVKDVRMNAFEHLQKLPLKYVDSHPYGETISRIITDVEQFSDGLLMGFSQLFTGVGQLPGHWHLCFLSMSRFRSLLFSSHHCHCLSQVLLQKRRITCLKYSLKRGHR